LAIHNRLNDPLENLVLVPIAGIDPDMDLFFIPQCPGHALKAQTISAVNRVNT